jgi:Tfp pilus assembly protein FimT
MKQWNNEKSFTITELLVITAMISILSSITLISLRAGSRQFALENAVHKLSQDLRRAQAMAMAAKECPIDKCGGPPAVTPSRYGIELQRDRDYYFLFADLNDNGKYEASDVEVERVTFEKGVRIQELFTPDSKITVWVAFRPPNPLTTIRDPGERSSLRIQLINPNNQTKIVSVNEAGLIAIE